MSYQDALAKAKDVSVEINQPMAVVQWYHDGSYTAILLSSFTCQHPSEVQTLAATVDHNGNVTESKWIKDKREVAA